MLLYDDVIEEYRDFATYAAGFLRRLSDETGSWSEAAGAFHSRTPEHAARYRALFDRHYAAVMADGVGQGHLAGRLALSDTRLAQAPVAAEPFRTNTYPLLQAKGGTPRLGSLVPLGDG